MMKTTIIISTVFFLACTMISAAPVHDDFYVNAANPTPQWPYDTWEKAAADIQTAVDAASNYDHVIVTNGIYDSGETVTPDYALSNRIVITKNITVRSVNGPENTIILGAEAPGGGNGDGAVRCVFMTAGKLYGFTISNGFTHKGGSVYYDLAGGGIWLTNYCVITNCIISGNSSGWYGGGALCYKGGSISDCTISGNSTGIGGALYNCTVAGNYASDSGGGIVCSNGGIVINTIIYDNQAAGGSHNWRNYASGAAFSFCCTTPTNGLPGGNDCIFTDPEFADTIPPDLDYRLDEISPCIDAGLNMPWTMAPGATDLDGNPRIYAYTQYRVDMGCYEFIPESGGVLIFGIFILFFWEIKLKLALD